MNLRFDLILSYWIFAWFLLYLYDVVPYSPHLALILALLFEIGISIMRPIIILVCL
jgi:hypothetical protein